MRWNDWKTNPIVRLRSSRSAASPRSVTRSPPAGTRRTTAGPGSPGSRAAWTCRSRSAHDRQPARPRQIVERHAATARAPRSRRAGRPFRPPRSSRERDGRVSRRRAPRTQPSGRVLEPERLLLRRALRRPCRPPPPRCAARARPLPAARPRRRARAGRCPRSAPPRRRASLRSRTSGARSGRKRASSAASCVSSARWYRASAYSIACLSSGSTRPAGPVLDGRRRAPWAAAAVGAARGGARAPGSARGSTRRGPDDGEQPRAADQDQRAWASRAAACAAGGSRPGSCRAAAT